MVGLNLYKISDPKQRAVALKKLPSRSSMIVDNTPRGWILGFPYCGYIAENATQSQGGSSVDVVIYILTTKKYYTSITKLEEDKNDMDVKIWERNGPYFNIYWTSRKYNGKIFEPRPYQKKIIKKITKQYNRDNKSVGFIYGASGLGKSIIPLILACKLDCHICYDHNPSEPNDTLQLLYNSVCPTKEKPLILVMDEGDILIKKLHDGKISANKYIPIQMSNKSGFNSYFDRIDNGLFPYLIILLTSNTDIDEINSIDPSYLRKGRFDITLEINKNNIDEEPDIELGIKKTK